MTCPDFHVSDPIAEVSSSAEQEAGVDARLIVFAGPASIPLGTKVTGELRISAAPYECRRFPDGEAQIELGVSVRGCDVFLLQSTSPPVEEHLFEALLLADACRRAGAARLTAVIPYFGYARQDRRMGRRSLGARVAADALGAARLDRLILIDAHTPALEGFFAMPIDHLTAVPLLARSVAAALQENSIVVAPDLGAVKLARAYARTLNVPMAFVHKTRLDGRAVEAHGVIGDVRDRAPVIVDDMLSTGATIRAAVGALRSAGAREPMAVAVTHGLFVGEAPHILRELLLSRITASDTVDREEPAGVPLDLVSVSPLIASAIRRTHSGDSLADLRVTE
jgi:ribose-phosphate pyrophosphokinase